MTVCRCRKKTYTSTKCADRVARWTSWLMDDTGPGTGVVLQSTYVLDRGLRLDCTAVWYDPLSLCTRIRQVNLGHSARWVVRTTLRGPSDCVSMKNNTFSRICVLSAFAINHVLCTVLASVPLSTCVRLGRRRKEVEESKKK